MGITDLKRFLIQQRLSLPANPSQFMAGSRVALDMHLYTHQIAFDRHVFELDDQEQQQQVLCEGVLEFHKWLRDMYIEPVYVFDGFYKPLKKRIIASRKAMRAQSQEKQVELEKKVDETVKNIKKVLPVVDKVTKKVDTELMEALGVLEQDSKSRKKVESPAQVEKVKKAQKVVEKKVQTKTKKEQDQVKKALTTRIETKQEIRKASKTSFGLKTNDFNRIFSSLDQVGGIYLRALGDAESTCAYLSRQDVRMVNYAGSEDYDTLAFGSGYMVQGLYRSFLGESEKVFISSLSDTLESLNLKYESFLDLCVLCGCEYIDSVSRSGSRNKLSPVIIQNLSDSLTFRDLNGRFPDGNSPQVDSILAKLQLPEYQVAKEHFKNPDVHKHKGVPSIWEYSHPLL